MKYKLVKKGNNVNFINCENGNGFDYVEFADKLYVGDKIYILKIIQKKYYQLSKN